MKYIKVVESVIFLYKKIENKMKKNPVIEPRT